MESYLIFFLLLLISYFLGYYILPEGSLKEIPLLSVVTFQESNVLIFLVVQTLIYNSFMIFIIVGANLLKVKSFPFGYLPLFGNVIILGLFAGTDSFSGGISSHSVTGWLYFIQIGLLEFSAYIFTCSATANIDIYRAEKWHGEDFQKVRGLKDIRLSLTERVLIIVAILFLIFAAINEWRFFFLD